MVRKPHLSGSVHKQVHCPIEISLALLVPPERGETREIHELRLGAASAGLRGPSRGAATRSRC